MTPQRLRRALSVPRSNPIEPLCMVYPSGPSKMQQPTATRQDLNESDMISRKIQARRSDLRHENAEHHPRMRVGQRKRVVLECYPSSSALWCRWSRWSCSAGVVTLFFKQIEARIEDCKGISDCDKEIRAILTCDDFLLPHSHLVIDKSVLLHNIAEPHKLFTHTFHLVGFEK
jgi:hypothetical protein